MKRLSLFFSVECIISFFLTVIGVLTRDNHAFSFGIVLLNTLFLMYFVIKEFNTRRKHVYAAIILISYLLRMSLVFFDVFIRELSDNADLVDFRNSAEVFFYTGEPLFRGQFSISALALGSIYKVFGVQRLLLQHTGVVMVTVSGFLLYKVLTNLQVSEKAKTIAMAWLLFSPWNMYTTSMSNREPIIIFFITLSFYFFVLWFISDRLSRLLISIGIVIFAAMLHGGVIAVAAGYLFVYVFYNTDRKAFIFKPGSFVLALLLGIAFLYLYINYSDVLFSKITGVDSILDITDVQAHGGSGYHAGGENTDSAVGFIIFTLPRMFYFIGSPFPWDWRNTGDAVAFIISGLIYLTTIFLAIWNARKNVGGAQSTTYLKAMLFVGIISIITFAWGVSNAGTAMRHREKLLAIFSTMLALGIDSSKNLVIKSRVR